MRLNIHDLKNWTECRKPLRFKGEGARIIELHVNCDEKTKVRVKHGDKQEHVTLAGVLQPGVTELRAELEGDVILAFETVGEVGYHDPSGRNVRREAPEQVSFTGPLNRIARDPEVERLMHLMEARMINQQRKRDAEVQNQLAQMRVEKAKGATVNQETGEVTENVKDDPGTTGSGEAAPSGDANSGGGSGGETPSAAGAGEGQSSGTAAPPAPVPAAS